MGVNKYRASSAAAELAQRKERRSGVTSNKTAAEWRRQRRPSVLGERDNCRAIFQGLEDIDNIIIGEKIQPDDSSNHDAPINHHAYLEVKRGRTSGEHEQKAAAERMHNGLCSVGETKSISDQVQQLTTLPRLPQAPASPPTSRSPQLAARAKKYRRVSQPAESSVSPLPGIQVTDATGLGSKCPSVSPPQSRRTSISDCSGESAVSPPQSRRSSISDSSAAASLQSSRAQRKFVCHKDLFASVLTPRSRSTLPSLRTSYGGSSRQSRSTSPLSSPLPSPLLSSNERRPSLGGASFALVDEGCPTAISSTLPIRHKMSPREQEYAAKSLRLLVFGRGKAGTNGDKLKAFYDEAGTKKQHIEFFDFWSQVDPDMFGEAKFSEFQSLVSRLESENNIHHLQSHKITSLLLNRESGLVIIDDVIEAIWPELAPEEIEQVWEHIQEEQEKRRRVAVDEPLLLPVEERKALERVFKDLDAAKTGYVSFETLAAARDECDLPIIDPDRLKHYAAEWDIWWGPLGLENAEAGNDQRRKSRDRSGSSDRRQSSAGSQIITLKSFLLMMCPAGFRAFEDAEVTTHETGSVLIRSNSGTWHAV